MMHEEQFPLVSVVIPCYNAEKWIQECIHSVLMQRYRPIEIVVVDDASTDKSVEEVTKLQQQSDPRMKYPCITLLKNETNLGECKTSAKGFDAARGKYICRLSADDMFADRYHLSRQVIEMETNLLDFCYNSLRLQGESLERSERKCPVLLPVPVKLSREWMHIFDNVLLHFPNVCYLITAWNNPINSSSLMIRNSTYQDKLTWDGSGLRSCCDTALIAKMFLKNLKGKAIHEFGSLYRIHTSQATGTTAASYDLRCIQKQIYHEGESDDKPLWMRAYSKIKMRDYLG